MPIANPGPRGLAWRAQLAPIRRDDQKNRRVIQRQQKIKLAAHTQANPAPRIKVKGGATNPAWIAWSKRSREIHKNAWLERSANSKATQQARRQARLTQRGPKTVRISPPLGGGGACPPGQLCL